MLAALIITLRETLEAALIVGIILAYLKKIKNKHHSGYVYIGIFSAILVSILLAILFNGLFGGFTGRAEELYEGFAMIFAGGLLTWMILWMFVQSRNMRKNLEGKIDSYVNKNHYLGVFLLTFVNILREGVETVIFLEATLIQNNSFVVFLGAISGILRALLLAYVLLKEIVRIPLAKFFKFTSLLLIFFAAGLFAHGIHELQEAGVVPVIVEHLWDINPSVITEGVYPIFHEKGVVGSFLKGLFGYNGNPSLLEVLTYFAYFGVISVAWNMILKRKVT